MIIKNDLSKAKKIVILLHGRGGDAQDILNISNFIPNKDVSFIAVTANNNQWYPYPFTNSISSNQPYLSKSLEVIDELINYASKFVSQDKIYVVGFSQGACLALHYIATNNVSIAQVIAFSGGLIGLEEELKITNKYNNNIFIGCSSNDPFINIDRVKITVDMFKKNDFNIKTLIYDANSHIISKDELNYLKQLLS